MGLHKPFDREFIVNEGSTMKTGYSLKLAKSQIGVFETTNTTVDGMKAVESYKGKPKTNKYEIKLGKSNNPVTRSHNNKSYSTMPFSLNNVMDLKVSAPEITEQSVDEVIVGYNGIDDTTAITFSKGDRKKLVVRLSGEPIGTLGYKNSFVDIPVYMEADDCSPYDTCVNCDSCESVDCMPIVLEAIETLKRHKLKGGVTVSQFADITPIRSCNTNPNLTLTPYKFHTLSVCDTGDSGALSLVQAQYPDYIVERTNRQGATSTYELLSPTSATIADYVQTIGSIIKGCEDCPTGYTEVEGGVIYAVTLEDDGTDKTADVQAMANAVANTAKKLDVQDNGVGYYTVVLTSELSDADFATFIDDNSTATITLAGITDSICDNSSITKIAWVDGNECNVTTQEYTIDLPDNECGENRLAELQSAFPNLTIALEGTTGGCQTRYKTSTKTNLVCDECDDIFKDYFKSVEPETFDGNEWTVVGSLQGSDCKCGIRIKGKVMEIHPDECLIDELGFVDSSVKIQATGGFITEVRAGEDNVDETMNVEYKSKAKSRTHLGGNLYQYEQRSMAYFTGQPRHEDSLVTRMLLGEEHVLKSNKQYVDYALTVRREIYSQSFAGTQQDNVTYHIFVEVGRHQDVENMLNMLASASGIPTVKAFGQ